MTIQQSDRAKQFLQWVIYWWGSTNFQEEFERKFEYELTAVRAEARAEERERCAKIAEAHAEEAEKKFSYIINSERSVANKLRKTFKPLYDFLEALMNKSHLDPPEEIISMMVKAKEALREDEV